MAKRKTKPAAPRRRKPNFPVPPEQAGPPSPPGQSCIVVGVGASAGGLEAFSELLRHLPVNTGMAFVLVQHLDPKHESLLPELLSRTTKIPVTQVSDGMPVGADHVYVIPPNTHMAITNGVLSLKARPDLGHHAPVDHFLCSLALDQGPSAIGVILSGTASDGTLGMKAIKAEGGITFAQDSSSAKYDGMPRSAVAAGCIDFVLPPAGIARELARIAAHPYLARPETPLTAGLPSEDGSDFRKILGLLRQTSGIDFTQYKHATIRRRVLRRMVLGKLENLSNYHEHLRENSEELSALYHDILIHVTGFFREPEAFAALRKRVLSDILKDHSRTAPLRIWVPGCSTGEEPYSIAICVLECIQEAGMDLPIQLFATDISEPALEKARQGLYTEAVVRDVSPERLRRFFVKMDRGYQVARALREMCVFARQDVTRDPPFSRLDLISCRNLLIYLGAVLQKRVLSIFHYALKPAGFLVLGVSETIGSSSDLFELVDRKQKIYSRKPAETPLTFDLPRLQEGAAEEGLARVTAELPTGLDLQKEADRIVLSSYAPAGVVIDRNLRIIQFRGQTGPYLEPAPGEASLHLLKMAREGLGVDLRAAIHTAAKRNTRVRKEGLKVRHNGQLREVNLDVIPLQHPGAKERCFLVLFEDVPLPPAVAPLRKTTRTSTRPDHRETARLKHELASTKQYLQSIIEEHEAGTEELKSANEEIQSSNEELQSTNEELETAKEELQSANEELTTVNEELQNRNLELSQANNDLSNLLTSANIPIVMLGSNLCIRRFTPVAEKVLNLIPSDVGRPVTDLKPNIDVPDLADRIRDVIETLRVQKLEVTDRAGHWHTLWIRPYRTADNKIDGAVLALVDTDELRQSLEQVRASRDFAAAILETIQTCILILDGELRVKTANRAFYKTFSLSPQQTQGQLLFHSMGSQWDIPALRIPLEDVAAHNTRFEGFEIDLILPQVGRKTVLASARRLDQQGIDGQLILLALWDLTEHKKASADLRSSEQRFDQMAESIRDVFYIQDAWSNRIIYVSPAYETIWGRTCESLYADPDSWVESVHADDRPRVLEAAKTLPEAERRLEYRILRPEGAVRWVSVRASPVLNETGQVTRVAGIVEDITERKLLEEEFRQSQKMEAIGRLAGGLAHDFNNLLTAIGGYSELLLEEIPRDDNRRAHVLPIQEAAQRAAELTRRVLAFSRRQTLQPEILDLNALVSGLGAMLRTLIGEDVELVTTLASGLHRVKADPSQLEQVLLNLAVNARDAMPQGGKLTIETADAGSDGSRVLLAVSDTGHGMDAETLDHVFEPFFTTKPQGQGTGLGLSTVYGVVKQSGGDISVSSEPGRGTKFTISLPAAREAASTVAPAPEAAATPKGSETILVVEDEDAVRKLACGILKRNGYQVLEARDAEGALAICAQHAAPIHLVVTDVVMPGMGGRELAERLVALRPGMRALFISGHARDILEGDQPWDPGRAYLHKPFTLASLLGKVREMLQAPEPPAASGPAAKD